jgi:glycosyltransferase involved in cell wall biosynthesis
VRAPPFFVHYPGKGGLILTGLQRALRDHRPDVVHVHGISAAALALGGALYARRERAAFFYSVYHHPRRLRLDAIRKSLLRAMNYLPLRTASKIYFLTARDFGTFSADYGYAPRERFASLLTGAEPRGATRSPTAARTRLNLLFVGRVDDARKGFAILETAVDALSADLRAAFVLTVVGTIGAATRQRLETKYGAAIRVLGPVSEPDLEQAYADADVFVMPSLYEGFGMPYIEAMRYGIPVIGTNSGGTPEIVPPETGLLPPPGDAAAVSAAIARLLTDPDLRRRMGSAGEAWSKRFMWGAIIEGLEADYRSAVEGLATNGRR